MVQCNEKIRRLVLCDLLAYVELMQRKILHVKPAIDEAIFFSKQCKTGGRQQDKARHMILGKVP